MRRLAGQHTWDWGEEWVVSYFDLKKSRRVGSSKPVLTRENGLKPLAWKGLGPFLLCTVADQPTLWEAIMPDELRRLPVELARVDGLLDDPVFFAPFVPFFDPRIGRP